MRTFDTRLLKTVDNEEAYWAEPQQVSVEKRPNIDVVTDSVNLGAEEREEKAEVQVDTDFVQLQREETLRKYDSRLVKNVNDEEAYWIEDQQVDVSKRK